MQSPTASPGPGSILDRNSKSQVGKLTNCFSGPDEKEHL
jgi:hypothetical protein